MMKKALVVVVYARFDYFERVFASIMDQEVDGRPVHESYDIHVFQDGLWEGESEANRAGHARIADLLAEVDGNVRVHGQVENLAVARHFDFIERRLFVDLGYDLVTFFEDDMVLAPGYMAAMDDMADRFRDDPRVGMFSANPGDTTRPLDEQRARRGEYESMGHNWGFGLFRSFWLRRQTFVDHYLKWTNAFPYRQRPTPDILKWLEDAGFKPMAASQDFVKQCATVALGAVRVATTPNFGLPIGEVGLHCNPKAFQAMGFDRTVLFDEPIGGIAALSDATYRAILARQMAEVVADPVRFDAVRWAERLSDGEFNPESVVAEVLARRPAAATTTQADVVACYRLLLGRPPESDVVVQSRVGKPPAEVLATFLNSEEFAQRSAIVALITEAADRLGGPAARVEVGVHPVADETLLAAQARIARLERKIGQLTLELDQLRERAESF